MTDNVKASSNKLISSLIKIIKWQSYVVHMAKHIMVGDPYLVGALGPPAPLNPALMVTQKRSLFHPVRHISLFPSAINMFWLYYNLNHGT